MENSLNSEITAAKIPNSPRFHRGSNKEFLMTAIVSEFLTTIFHNAEITHKSLVLYYE